MSYFGSKDAILEISRGNVTGIRTETVFGQAPNGLQLTATDIWDRADATPTQQIWSAPTAARIHTLVSSSASDDGSPAGIGAQTIQVYGLQTWASAETSETITMNGITGVNTANSYVMINKLEVTASGASGPTVGTITATAATDSTVTAVIRAGEGRSENAIYGIPSTQTAYITGYNFAIEEAGGTPSTAIAANVDLMINTFPDTQPAVFIKQHAMGVSTTGSNIFNMPFVSYKKVAGPAIIKIQAISSQANTNVSAGFDLFIVDN